MMLVKVVKAFSTQPHNVHFDGTEHAVGDELDLPDDVAHALIDHELVEVNKPAKKTKSKK